MDRDFNRERFIKVLIEILQKYGPELLDEIEERERQEMDKKVSYSEKS